MMNESEVKLETNPFLNVEIKIGDKIINCNSGAEMSILNSNALDDNDTIQTGRIVELIHAFGGSVSANVVQISCAMKNKSLFGPEVALLVATTDKLSHEGGLLCVQKF